MLSGVFCHLDHSVSEQASSLIMLKSPTKSTCVKMAEELREMAMILKALR